VTTERNGRDGSDGGGAGGAGEDAAAEAVRVRGVYATALTRLLLDAGFGIADPSEAIRRRFDATFHDGGHAVAVAATDDRQGVGVAGEPGDVGRVRSRLAGVGRDALDWDDPAPPGAVFDGRVAETLGGGAAVDLGDVEGYLPYDATADRIEVGDEHRLAVVEPAPPWDDRRPELDTTVRVPVGPATLIRGDDVIAVEGADEDARELAGLVDLLGLEPPAGWGIRFGDGAAGLGTDALSTVADRARDRARRLEASLAAGVDPPAPVSRPNAGAWVWFGRESRFALDERRRAVTTTMPGHHRIKAGAEAASAGVDFVEALCEPAGEFPFEVVAGQFGPNVGDVLRIEHGKPDGRLLTLGRGRVVEREGPAVTIERELTSAGSYDGLGTPREPGDTAVTKLKEGRWWYATTYTGTDGELKGTYLNVCTPLECFPGAVRYVDLHVDVVKRPDGSVERVDGAALDDAVEEGNVPAALAENARSVAAGLESAIG